MTKQDDSTGATEQDLRDFEFARMGDRFHRTGTVLATTISCMSMGPAQNTAKTVVEGCQWAETCDGCPWPDCVIAVHAARYGYASKEAAEIRRRFADGGDPPKIDGKPVTKTEAMVVRNTKMAVMYVGGTREKDIAVACDVHVRTVRRVVSRAIGDNLASSGHRRMDL